MKIGVLDIGSNSIHMVLAELDRGKGFEVLARSKDMTRLGDGTLSTGLIAPEKLDRAVAVVKQLTQLAKSRGVAKILTIATAAVREASNGGELVDRIEREAGIKIRPVTGEEEARLIYLAVRHYMDLSKGRTLILDVGGGSAELIVGTAKEMPFARSLKLGVARLKDLFISRYPVPKGDHERVHRHLRATLEPTLAEVRKARPTSLVGTSGTIINLGSILHERREDRPLGNPLGFRFTRDDLEELHDDLAKCDDDELLSLPGVDPDRADLLLPGACLVLEVMDALDLGELALCDKAIREGVILDYISRAARKLALEAEVPNVRLRSVLQLARRCEFGEVHARATARIAVSLFDQLPLPRDLHPSARELLEHGALLHDIGYHVSHNDHHKHAAYLIKNSELAGFSPEEIAIIAGLARYHRRRGPKRKDEEMGPLSARDRRTVVVLTAVLRVADGLDRTRFGIVQAVRVVTRPKAISIRVAATEDPALEVWTANQKADLLREVLGRDVQISVEPPSPVSRPRAQTQRT